MVIDGTKKVRGSISNVIKEFNTILSLPVLTKVLDTPELAPAVGILNAAVQHATVTLDKSSKMVPSWRELDKLSVALTTDETTPVFLYRSSIFYVAIGKSIWAKMPRVAGDRKLFKAATIYNSHNDKQFVAPVRQLTHRAPLYNTELVQRHGALVASGRKMSSPSSSGSLSAGVRSPTRTNLKSWLS